MLKTRILIAGGGIGGLTAAIALIKHGFEVHVYEQAPEIGEFGAGIAIGIFTIVSIGTRREERIFREERIIGLRDSSSPGRAASAARAFHGHYSRTPLVDYEGAHQRDNLRVLNGGAPPS